MKVRGVQIQERDLVATICDYALDFRVRSQPLMEGACEYFLHHGSNLTTPQVNEILSFAQWLAKQFLSMKREKRTTVW